MKILREPLVHFLILGAVIYAASALLTDPADDPASTELVVSAGDVEWMAASWTKRWNRAPTPEELDGLIRQHVRETILYREALSMGLDRDDVVIRRRLAQKLEFLAKDLATMTQPGDEELRGWFDKHHERYLEPMRYTFTQVFFDPDKRGDATLADAEAIKATLASQPDALVDAGRLGDRLLQSYYPENDRVEVQRNFGAGFAESLVTLAPGRWHGPVLSGYGVHLVYVHDVVEPPPPEFDVVREQVLQDWTDERRETLNEAFFAGLRERYTVVIESPEGGETLAGSGEPAS